MSTTYRENTTCSDTTPDTEDLSGTLLAMLSEQVSLARKGKVEAVLTLAGKIDRLLRRADRKQLERIRPQRDRIQSLHNELCLMLGAARREVADELGRVRTGKNSLRAYKNASH